MFLHWLILVGRSVGLFSIRLIWLIELLLLFLFQVLLLVLGVVILLLLNGQKFHAGGSLLVLLQVLDEFALRIGAIEVPSRTVSAES
jgi:hypothetical protein